ncbi:serine hydrolase domain-containing protein [Streptomyces sp. NPDC053048]|uniref:serine hydrolase domain-containing protein n=1 Tax=Streptomyces sp. NPDC053048 TaxID=3365694 RepID=UPI0037D07A12
MSTEKGIWNGTAGMADLGTQRKRASEDRFRIGSVSKVFSSVVLLQMEAEGKLDLDDTVEKHLPGVVRGNGNDGSRITIRQLLNHTSGLFNYTDDEGFSRQIHEDYPRHRFQSRKPAEMLAVGLSHPPVFEPGKAWHYSNTNYILAGMITEKVAGHRFADEVERRIVQPLQLRGTSLPGTTTRMPDPHGRAYSKLYLDDPNAKTYDTTEQNPSWLWSAGEIISTTGDLNRFYQALLGGKLLPGRQQKELLTTVPTGIPEAGDYGLGIHRVVLPCGLPVWYHDGDIHGSKTLATSTEDGRHTAAFNINGDWAFNLKTLIESEYCGVTDTKAAD